MAIETAYLFVYGTLLTSAEHAMGAKLRSQARLVGTGSIQARLYIINDPDAPGQNFYPGALPAADPNDRVYGEVYEVLKREGLFEAFDEFEACSANWPEPHEFMRRTVTVMLEDGGAQTAATYLYTWDVGDAEPVPSGRNTQVAPDVR